MPLVEAPHRPQPVHAEYCESIQSMQPVDTDPTHPRAEAFRAFIKNPPFPCVGAKSALSKGQLRIVVARDITSAWDDLRIYPALLAFVASFRQQPDLFQSFAVVFEGPTDLSEAEFERGLWARAQSLSDKDAWNGETYDQRVTADPESPHFSLSFGGEAFFIVGLHPQASRPARRFSTPVLVFNLHSQFEQLRAEGRYEKLRESILQRDQILAGDQNPMLARHGEMSEARQYSGRVVGPDWRCPLTTRVGKLQGKVPRFNPPLSLEDLEVGP